MVTQKPKQTKVPKEPKETKTGGEEINNKQKTSKPKNNKTDKTPVKTKEPSKSEKTNKTPVKTKEPNKFPIPGFPDLLRCRFIVALTNLVWTLDATHFDVPRRDTPGSKMCVLLCIDLCTNKIMFWKTFFSSDGKKSFTTNAVIPLIGGALTQEEQTQRFSKTDFLIIHCDKGRQFCCNKYVDYISGIHLEKPHPVRIEGSQSPGGVPQYNSVIERQVRTIKEQLLNLCGPVPTSVKETRDFARFIDKKCKAYNKRHIPEKNLGLTPDQNQIMLSRTDEPTPEIVLARKSDKQTQPNVAEARIKQFHYEVSIVDEPPDAEELKHNQIIENQARIYHQNTIGLSMQETTHEKLNIIDDKINSILPKPKKFHRAIVDRDPAPNLLLEEILSDEKPKGSHALSWARFQMTAVLLAFGGLRINEIAAVTPERLETLIESKRLPFYQDKVNEVRTVYFGDRGVEIVKDVYNKTKDIIFEKDEVLFPLPPSGRKNNEKFVAMCNKFLKPYGRKHKLNLKSHSFRINFVTQALKHTTTHQAQQLVGHKDIRSTMKYNRHMMANTEKEGILNKMFEDS